MKATRWMAAVGLAAWAAGCGAPPEGTVAAGAEEEGAGRGAVAPPAVSGEAALEEVAKFVALGNRDSGTEGAERAAKYLAGRLGELGIEAQIQEFRDETPRGEMIFRNVVGKLPGTGEGILMMGSHYDTKSGIEGFEGANDSGSSTGLLLELARAFREGGPKRASIWFAFFDGEECMESYGPRDGFHGSRHMAGKLEEEGRLGEVEALILLDMVGDRDLTVTLPRNGTPWLTELAFEAARAEGVRRHFRLHPYAIGDDHVAFLERGVPAVNLIDFHFGTAPGANDHWHTAEDTMDKLSAESLGIVGRVAARMAEEILAGGGGGRK